MVIPHIGARCHVERSRCLIAPSQSYESRYPNHFERYLKTWESASCLLLESPQSDRLENNDVRVKDFAVHL